MPWTADQARMQEKLNRRALLRARQEAAKPDTPAVRDLRERFTAYDQDHLAVQRRIRRLCRHCYYLRRHDAVQVVTPFCCAHCGQFFKYPTHAVPLLCDMCADALKVCAECGAPMD